jgi:hypothetical protein
MPPPWELAALPDSVLLLIVSVLWTLEAPLSMPPPSPAVLLLRVELVRVSVPSL